MTPVLLSRIQFAWVIGWHILLPAFTVGLGSFVALLEGLNFATGRAVFLRLSSFWTRIFAISFGMGVVSGIVMPFQFGTNWSGYADATANVLSPLFAYEGLTAFFLEAAFLGVLLFGRKLVPAWAHFVAAIMVASGTLFSSFWILAANSWMQTPAGYREVDGRFYPTDWLAVIFNPSFPYRFAHTVVAFYVTTAFVVVGVAAYYIRRGMHAEDARLMLSMTLWLLSVLVPVQIFLGDQHGLNTLHYQPAKLAAIEAHWQTGSRVPLDAVRVAGRGERDKPRHDRDPAAREPDPDARSERRRARARRFSARPAAARRHPVLQLPHHGRDRHADAGARRAELVAALARAALRQRLVPAPVRARRAARALSPSSPAG